MENSGTGNEPLFMMTILVICFSIMGKVVLDTGKDKTGLPPMRRDLVKKFH